jgi:hypothetical protein
MPRPRTACAPSQPSLAKQRSDERGFAALPSDRAAARRETLLTPSQRTLPARCSSSPPYRPSPRRIRLVALRRAAAARAVDVRRAQVFDDLEGLPYLRRGSARGS